MTLTVPCPLIALTVSYGGTLSKMTAGSDTLYFTYDASGRPLSVALNGTTYYYATNLQGDVTAILNSSGTAVVTYTYDAWGNPLTTTGTLATTLGTLNPLRYRGYVYDQETGLYYLQSRYYDPQIGRWTSADSIIRDGYLLGYILFAYCDNDPVNKVDYSGESGKYYDLGQGWKYTIHPENAGTRTKRHIHIWKDGKEYIQNEDGSPHDEGKSQKGKLPKWLNNKLIEKAGWDYNGKRNSFFQQTSCEVLIDGIRYTFADGTTSFKATNPYQITRFSVDSYEALYFQSDTTYEGANNYMYSFCLPLIGPVNLPIFSFSWNIIPIPLLG